MVHGHCPGLTLSSERSSSMRSKRASPPKAVGARPVRVKEPKSLQRSRVTTVHCRGASGDTSTAAQPLVFWPL